MSAFLLLVVCLLIGKLIAVYAHPPIGLAQALNWWVINVALSALVLFLVPQLHLDWQLWFLVASQWLVFGGAWVLFVVLGRWFGWSRGRVGAMTLVCGLGNTAFMGYPMIGALRGHAGLMLAVVSDQLGAFIAMAVGGTLVAALYSGSQARPREIVRRIVLFPPFISIAVALIAAALGGWPTLIQAVLHRLGDTLTPLALFSVGLRFRISFGEGQLVPMLTGLGWKLFLAPLAALGIGLAAGVGGLTLTIGILQAAMAPMVSATIMADQHRLDPPLANSLLGMGILLCFVTVPAWNFLLG